MEYQALYHFEKQSTPEVQSTRWTEIESAILAEGTYDMTFDELEHGARVAWRNAPKCANRSKHMELTVQGSLSPL